MSAISIRPRGRRGWIYAAGSDRRCSPRTFSLAREVISIERHAELSRLAGAVLDELGGLPEEDRHCALLAANTLREAIGCIRPELTEKVKDSADV